jgi:chemotaxis protein methyltransferase CheR
MPGQTSSVEILPENYRFLQQHIYSQSGIVLESDKHYLLEARLAPVVRQFALGSINDLCGLLTSPRAAEAGRLVAEAMTTNETYFFRDIAHYEAIRKILLPRLKQERSDTRKLRFWSSAASTGQEAYSLAMLLYEEGLSSWNIDILGTDFSSQVLARARSGSYKQIEVNRGLPASLLVQHFRRCGVDWQLNDEIRRMVRFEPIDLRKKMTSLGPFDLVFCRNVLIYFDAKTKVEILKELHGTLFRGGWLFLGGTETVFGMEEWFERQCVGGATVYAAK